MALELKQSLKLAQQLVVTPQLQQAIKLLQLSQIELNSLVQNELLENPILEDKEAQPEEILDKQSNAEKHEQAKLDQRPSEQVDEVGTKDGELKEPNNFDWENYLDTNNSATYNAEHSSRSDEPQTYENVIRQTESLQEHLLWQLHLSSFTDIQLKIGQEIIGNIDDIGYFKASIDEISKKLNIPLSDVQNILNKIQLFDPLGVAARDIKECLCLQIKHFPEEREYLEIIINYHFADLEKHDYKKIAKALGIDITRIQHMAHIISDLEPRPGRPFQEEMPHYITPDVYVQKIGNDYVVTLNEDGLPKLRVSNFYRQALMKGSDVAKHTKEYIQERMRSAIWLIKSIHQRQRTLHRVTESIVKFQRDFFENGVEHLKPLILRDVADDIEMHESTISRVTTNKYVHTSRGIYELKFFFNSGIQQLEGGGIASEAVKIMIKNLIDKENSQKPYSDRRIVDYLKKHNIDIARRTVAKYREVLNILPSSRRRERS